MLLSEGIRFEVVYSTIYFQQVDYAFRPEDKSGFLALLVKKSNKATIGTNSFSRFLGLLQIKEIPIYYLR